MKGIILAGGTGSRVYPCTKTVSKQLLPIYDKPTIYYPLSTLIKLGIKDIMIITNAHAYPHLLHLFNQTALGPSGVHSADRNRPYLGINFNFKIQMTPAGIAEALIIAEGWQGDDNVCLILGDNIFTGIRKPTLNGHKACVVSYRVSNPSEYGVIDIDDEGKILSIEEKPDTPKSNNAVTGIYFYDNTAGARARNLKPSPRGELEITDLNKSYLQDDLLWHNSLNSNYAWFDTGNPDEMFAASMYVKSIQDRTNTMIGCIEGESWKQGNITEQEFKKIVRKMPDCSYKTNVAMSYFW
jgi:glucose-1-phosphate thymidylyltransferase